jgi:ankyrin repeat protein
LRQGDAAKVQASVNQGADVNSRDEFGNTLLMQAALYSTPALMQFLLERGADPMGANERRYNALMRSMPDLVKIKLLLERGVDVYAASV